MNDKTMTKLQYQALVLVQALQGVISPNFRRVWITVKDTITVNIVLEKESMEDLEEIEDLKSEFEALQEGPIDYDFITLISDGLIDYPDIADTITVYMRREY